MSLRVPGAGELLAFLDARRIAYVALRDAHAIARGEPPGDLDLLLDDEAVPEVRARYARCRRGLKVDLYGARGAHGSDYLGHPHLPEPLAERTLARRRAIARALYAPHPEDELAALLYHLAYHKSVQSGIHCSDPERSQASPFAASVRALARAAGVELPLSHEAFHAYLEAQGFAVSEERLVAYLQHDFRHGRKSFFHAALRAREPGEMNLFVIRRVAVRRGRAEALLARLEERFRLLAVKRVGWRARLAARRRMRGGKWRRGGLPHIAVVVYDPSPVAPSAGERAAHPFVFNRNQFVKVEWRRWFARDTGAPERANPIHSTDNEAEAIGHLPLFFDASERRRILGELARLRRGHRP